MIDLTHADEELFTDALDLLWDTQPERRDEIIEASHRHPFLTRRLRADLERLPNVSVPTDEALKELWGSRDGG